MSLILCTAENGDELYLRVDQDEICVHGRCLLDRCDVCESLELPEGE